MSAPNLASASTTVLGKTAVLAVTTTMTAILANAAASGECHRVEAVYACNISGSVAWVTLTHYRSSVDVEICYQLPIPVKGTFNLLGGRILYLEEGDSLRMKANAVSSVTGTVSYEKCS